MNRSSLSTSRGRMNSTGSSVPVPGFSPRLAANDNSCQFGPEMPEQGRPEPANPDDLDARIESVRRVPVNESVNSYLDQSLNVSSTIEDRTRVEESVMDDRISDLDDDDLEPNTSEGRRKIDSE